MTEFGGRMVAAASIQRIRHEARVVDGGQRNVVAGKRHDVRLGVEHDLQHRLVFEDRLQQIESFAQRHLLDGCLAREIEFVAAPMSQRHIGCVPRFQRQRHAGQLTGHGVGGVELRPEGEISLKTCLF